MRAVPVALAVPVVREALVGAGGAGGAVLGTMADAYANPVMVDALIFGREGTSVVPESTTLPFFTYYAPQLPPTIDDPLQLERWEAWVRAYTALGEMLQGISFNKTTSTTPARDIGFQVLSPTYVIAEIERPAEATFQNQIPMVLSWAELRNERATEIMAQIDPQYAFWSSIVYMHPDRTRRTFELINILLQFCVYVEMRFKHALACWRPVEYNAQVQPMITTPGHGAFPSGHSTQAHAVAHVLKALLNLNPDPLATPARSDTQRSPTNSIARRHASRPTVSLRGFISRPTAWWDACWAWPWANISSPVARRAKPTVGSSSLRRIDGVPATDFNPFSPNQQLNVGPFYSQTAGGAVTPSPLIGQLWMKAQQEWTGKFP